MSTLEDLASELATAFDQAARRYDRFAVDLFSPMGRTLVHRAAVRSGEHVLEVGCGRGATLLAALDVVGEHGSVLGVDDKPTMVQVTGARLRAYNSDVRLDDLSQPDFQPGSFDVVLANLMIFQLPDPALAMRNYATLLRPAGRLAFSTLGSPDRALVRAMGAIAGFAPNRESLRGAADPFRTEESIRGFVTRNGYSRIEITEDEFEIRFRDADQWLEWVWAYGGRSLLDSVPAEQLASARAAAFHEIEAARSRDGELSLTTRVRFTVAS